MAAGAAAIWRGIISTEITVTYRLVGTFHCACRLLLLFIATSSCVTELQLTADDYVPANARLVCTGEA